MTIGAFRPGEYLKPGDTEQVLSGKVGIALEMHFQKRLNRIPVRELARVGIGTAEQYEFLAVTTADVQPVRM
jgi:hypothetical protein